MVRFSVVLSFLLAAQMLGAPAAAEPTPIPEPAPSHMDRPQWLTGPRLLRLGETLNCRLFVPQGMAPGELTVFPRYLEQSARRARGFTGATGLEWLDRLPKERIPLTLSNGPISLSYRPTQPGSYIARWEVGGERLYRYFSVVTDDYTVVRYTTGGDWQPNWHSTGIPIEYRLEIEQFEIDNPLLQLYQGYQRRFGDGIVPLFPDTPDLMVEARAATYGEGLQKVRALLPDPADARAVQVAMMHPMDPGYIRSLMSLGVSDQGGMWQSNGLPWLGMPEFPYFASPHDMRKPSQAPGGSLVAHQWDFCGSWHFLGPPPWHYQVSEGDWAKTERCLRQSLDEARNLAEMSGHPAFVMPLFGGAQTDPITYPPSHFLGSWNVGEMQRYMERFVGWMAFAAPSDYKLVYARSIDVADYYRRHFKATLRTVFVSRTDHLEYDFWWLAGYAGDRYLVTTARIPWETSVPVIEAHRKLRKYVYKDPLSCEYIHIEDQRRQMRFERECPTPVWWFDYTRQETEVGPQGSSIGFVETPQVRVLRTKWKHTAEGLSMRLTMETQAHRPDYAIAVWGLPDRFSRDPGRWSIETNAEDFQVVKNTAGEHHLVLTFDLHPDAEIGVTLKTGGHPTIQEGHRG